MLDTRSAARAIQRRRHATAVAGFGDRQVGGSALLVCSRHDRLGSGLVSPHASWSCPAAALVLASFSQASCSFRPLIRHVTNCSRGGAWAAFEPTMPKGAANDPRGARQCARTSRRNLVFGWTCAGPDHEAAMRFRSEAPRQRAHSNERLDDRVPARVTATSDRHQHPARVPALKLVIGLSSVSLSAVTRRHVESRRL